jgi:hypothetical protein
MPHLHPRAPGVQGHRNSADAVSVNLWARSKLSRWLSGLLRAGVFRNLSQQKIQEADLVDLVCNLTHLLREFPESFSLGYIRSFRRQSDE